MNGFPNNKELEEVCYVLRAYFKKYEASSYSPDKIKKAQHSFVKWGLNGGLSAILLKLHEERQVDEFRRYLISGGYPYVKK